ncbi:hypothetical protein NV63_06785 [Elizabethkingia anophelis]|nr:hypothetical protein NV63_06785 [Elizabethkingia anophelis]
MENNLENKTKFFAQYWGQKIMIWDESKSLPPQKVGVSYMTKYGVSNRKLELKSLEDLTEDDLMTIAKYYEPTTYKVESNSDEIVFDYMYGDSFSSAAIGYDYGYALDYLRSKGYALPWMGLSVEKLVEYGWVKLKEKNDGK